MPSDSILVPNYTKETFRKFLEEYPHYPQKLVRGEQFIVQRISLYGIPTFYGFDVECTYEDGVVGVLTRKIVKSVGEAKPQLEDKVSFFRGETHLGSTRVFKVIDTDNPFRLIESEIADQECFGDYLISICHLAAYCAKSGGKGMEANLAQVLNHAASVAAVTLFALDEGNAAFATRCRDIIVNPLFRRPGEPRQSVEIRYAGQL
ncbi:MAG: hypothetical protein HGA96_03025 [Desulfobulbaceae bacterium]|nr:hypothetical protein [Desulfobulbaceae bacterium]